MRLLGLIVVALTAAAPAHAQPSPRPPATDATPSSSPPGPGVQLERRKPTPGVIAAAREPSLLEAAHRQRSFDRPHDLGDEPAAGMSLVYGFTQQHGGVPGWATRLEWEMFGTAPERGRSGALFGAMWGFEYWQVNPTEGERDFGFSMPLALVGGVRLSALRVLAGAGVDMVLVDHVARETGVGFYAPFALANAAIDLDGWRIGADARVERRWQFGADDHTQYQLTFNVGYTFTPERARPRRSVATIAR